MANAVVPPATWMLLPKLAGVAKSQVPVPSLKIGALPRVTVPPVNAPLPAPVRVRLLLPLSNPPLKLSVPASEAMTVLPRVAAGDLHRIGKGVRAGGIHDGSVASGRSGAGGLDFVRQCDAAADLERPRPSVVPLLSVLLLIDTRPVPRLLVPAATRVPALTLVSPL